MIKVEITKDMIRSAGRRAKKIPPSRNTFMPFDRHVAGFVGEEMLMKTFNNLVESKGSEVYYYDFTASGIKYEAKTKLVTSTPRLDYECSTYTYFNQKPDILLFNRVFNANKNKKYCWPHGWILGWIEYDRFQEIKTLIPKGQVQPNGFTTRTSTWNIFIRDLNPIETLFSGALDSSKESGDL